MSAEWLGAVAQTVAAVGGLSAFFVAIWEYRKRTQLLRVQLIERVYMSFLEPEIGRLLDRLASQPKKADLLVNAWDAAQRLLTTFDIAAEYIERGILDPRTAQAFGYEAALVSQHPAFLALKRKLASEPWSRGLSVDQQPFRGVELVLRHATGASVHAR